MLYELQFRNTYDFICFFQIFFRRSGSTLYSDSGIWRIRLVNSVVFVFWIINSEEAIYFICISNVIITMEKYSDRPLNYRWICNSTVLYVVSFSFRLIITLFFSLHNFKSNTTNFCAIQCSDGRPCTGLRAISHVSAIFVVQQIDIDKVAESTECIEQ